MTDSKQEKHSEIHRILSELLPTEEGRKIVADSLADVFNLNIGWRCLWRRVLSRDENWGPVEAPVQSNSVFSVTEDGDTVFIQQVVEELIRPVDTELIRRLSLGVEWVDYSQGDIPKMLEDYREYTDTHEGVVIMNAPTYAWVRKWGREYLEVITERKVLLTGQMATFGRMNLFVSRLMLDGQVFFAPKGVGRYTEALTVDFHKEVAEASPLTQWKASLNTHLEIGSAEAQVRGVRLDMGTKP